jgi:hypothetical protein
MKASTSNVPKPNIKAPIVFKYCDSYYSQADESQQQKEAVFVTFFRLF